MILTRETLATTTQSRAAPGQGDAFKLVTPPKLGDGEVHVWWLQLDPPKLESERLSSYLSLEEQQRAEQFVFSYDRHRFSAARRYLRYILAQYIGCQPSEVQFRYGDNGKPYLGGLLSRNDLRFNISHSGKFGLFAVAHGRELGVDIEFIRPEVDILSVAHTSFSPAERSCLLEMPPNVQRRAFFDCWTRKEAYIKARGEGLAYPLDAFDVRFRPGAPAALLRSAEGPSELARWFFQSIDVGPDYAAALVAEQQVTRVQLFCQEPAMK